MVGRDASSRENGGHRSQSRKVAPWRAPLGARRLPSGRLGNREAALLNDHRTTLHRWAGRSLLLLVALLAVSGSPGCADSACALSCGSGVDVWWDPADVPDAARHELCINGDCEPVVPRGFGDAGQYQRVSPAGAPAIEVDVTIRFLTAAGETVDEFHGSGVRTGECCAGIAFRVHNGVLVEEYA